jgi:hypothetical protein
MRAWGAGPLGEEAKVAETHEAQAARKAAEEARAAEDRRVADQRRVAEERRAAEERQAADDRRRLEEKRAAEAKELVERQRVCLPHSYQPPFLFLSAVRWLTDASSLRSVRPKPDRSLDTRRPHPLACSVSTRDSTYHAMRETPPTTIAVASLTADRAAIKAATAGCRLTCSRLWPALV